MHYSVYCRPVGPGGGTGCPAGPTSSSPLLPVLAVGFVSVVGSLGSPLPSGFGGDFVPGPPRFCQSSHEPRYSPTFKYLTAVSSPYLAFRFKLYYRKGGAYPACLAIPAAAELRTPALQKNTTSFALGGFWNPKRSSKSSSLRSSASGCDVTGMLMEVGIVLASNSCGSRTSMRRRESEGCSRVCRTLDNQL